MPILLSDVKYKLYFASLCASCVARVFTFSITTLKDYDLDNEMNEEKKKVEREDGLSQDTFESEENDDVFDEREINEKIGYLEEKREWL